MFFDIVQRINDLFTAFGEPIMLPCRRVMSNNEDLPILVEQLVKVHLIRVYLTVILNLTLFSNLFHISLSATSDRRLFLHAVNSGKRRRAASRIV